MILRLLLALWLGSYALWADLPSAIGRFLSKDKIDPAKVSILITETRSGKTIAEHRADDSRLPASVIKLATTYAALRELGTDWRWPTRFEYTGRFSRGEITGDLVVKAYGDPTLSRRHIPGIVKRLKRMGVRKIRGDLILDRSFFATDGRISSGFDNHPYSEYNAMPDALMFDDHLCHIAIDARGGTPQVSQVLSDPGYRISNQLKVTSKSCRGRYRWPRISIRQEEGKPTVVVSGTLSSHCAPMTVEKVLSQPYYSFFAALTREFRKQGIEFEGSLRLQKAPKSSRPLMTHLSDPLIKIVAKTNKKSNNLYARHIFLLLGAKRYGAPATEAKGRKAVKEILGSRGILGKETILDNGCGLSRRTRTTVRAMHRLLQDAYKAYAWKWMGTLAVAGVDGTIKKRFRNTPVRKRAWMKTGTLKNAKNIAGYVKGRSGKLYTVVIFYNGPQRWLGSLLQNQILEWIVKNK